MPEHKAYAKINWSLSVKSPRDDGFHEIESLIQKVSLHDTLSIFPSRELEVSTNADIPLMDNLVFKAAEALRKERGVRGGVSIGLEKRIPMEAGLGGGSSDAAATLMGLCALWKIPPDDDAVKRIASDLGSDVPFFMGGPAAVVSGRGEKVEEVRIERTYPLLIVKPPVGVSTGWAYKNIRRRHDARPPDTAGLIAAINSGDKERITELARNDLELGVSVVHSVIRHIREELLSAGAFASLMTGSGSTVFGVFENRFKASRAALKMQKKSNYFVEEAETLL
jgi:4-diphosphocytidyl-2-C-methyl-D-erythritol kinase